MLTRHEHPLPNDVAHPPAPRWTRAGGLLIVQVRGRDGPCISPLYSGFDSAYKMLAPRLAPAPPLLEKAALLCPLR